MTCVKAIKNQSRKNKIDFLIAFAYKYDYIAFATIDKTGLIPKSRLYVHLSGDEDTAVKVGSRHGKPVIYKVAAGKMERAGYAFFLSVNGVWLTKEVPKEYLIKME